jgi:hypothetical protein
MKKNITILNIMALCQITAIFTLLAFSNCTKNNGTVTDPCAKKNCSTNEIWYNCQCSCTANFVRDPKGNCVDPCSLVNCGTHGKCTTGICECDLGYEKDALGRCEITSRDKFRGSFTVLDTCSSTRIKTYIVTISDGTAINEVKIANMWDGAFTNKVKATVGSVNIQISRQSPDNDRFFIEGFGYINDKTITLNYKITDVSGLLITDACNSKWVKK